MKLLPLMPDGTTPRNETISPIVHKCQVPPPQEEVELLIPGSGFKSRLKKWMIRHCIVSRDHPFTRLYIKSTAGINYEIDRHLKHSLYIIHPFSELRNAWNIFMTFFTLVSLILVPFVLTFHFHRQRNWLYLYSFINLVFCLDVIMNFFVGYFDSTTRAVVLDKKFIVRKYLKTFFLPDFLSGFPVEVLSIVWSVSNNANEVDWYWTVGNTMKIFRLRNLIVYTRQLCRMHKVSFQKSKIIELVLLLIICLHWATCLELYIPLTTGTVRWDDNPRSWLGSNYMKSRNTIFKRYIASLNRATIALTSSSHFLPVNTTEDMIFNLILTIFGRIGFIYILAQLMQLMTTFNSTKKRCVKEVQQFYEYMKYKGLPRSIQKRLFTYYSYYQKDIDRDKLIISQVSPNLREELLLHIHREMIANVELLKHIPQPILSQVITLVKREMYLPEDIIVKHGAPADALYFISWGTVGVINANGDEICRLEKNSYFGEVCLVNETETHSITVVALEMCEISIIKRSEFLNILNPHTNVLNRLQRVALTKFERINRRL